MTTTTSYRWTTRGHAFTAYEHPPDGDGMRFTLDLFVDDGDGFRSQEIGAAVSLMDAHALAMIVAARRGT